MSVLVFVEGGGDRSALKRACRAGFSEFLRKAGFVGTMPRIVACGSRQDALDDFKTALSRGEHTVLLLVDAEGPVRAPVSRASPWQHLKDSDGWIRPNQASDDQCHLMVQAMESWFLADRTTLRTYFGKGFQDGALPQNPNIEGVPIRDVESRLRQATRETRKGDYSRAKHSFEILAAIDPARVREQLPYADRFLSALEQVCRK